MIAFLVIIIGLAAVGTYGIYSINSITGADQVLYNKGLMGVSSIADITETFFSLRTAALKTAYENFTADGAASLQKTLDNAKTQMNSLFEGYAKTIDEQEDQANLDTVKSGLDEYYGNISKVISIIQANDSANLKDQMEKTAAASTKVTDQLNVMQEYIDKEGEATMNSNKSLGSTSNILMIAIAAAAGVVAVAFALTVTRGITRPVNKLVDAARRIAEGDTDISLDIKTKDEVGILAGAFDEMVASIKKLIGDANMLVENAIQGQLSARADASQHSGDYRKIIEGVNSMLDAVMQPLDVVMQHLDQLSHGISADLIDTDRYNGDFKDITDNLNRVRLALRALVRESTVLAEAAIEGRLDTRADAGNHEGVYRNIIEGFNNTLDAVVGPISESRAVLAELSQGNLNTAVTGEYKGDHAILKNALNETISSIKGYIGEISATLGEMAQGNLTVEITSDYRGDFIQLKNSINHIINSLNDLMQEIHTASEQVSEGSKQVSDGNQAVSQGAAEQASSIEELTASISQIADQTNQNAENSNKSNQAALQAKTAAMDGNGQMKEMLKSMQDINESSENISKIIKVIDDIAFQTNILALNAAVEAARAGIHGKGFAVVAEEVRNLAARSANAAKETTELIEGSIKKVGEGTRIAEATAAALENIVSSVEKTVELGEEIAVASREQATGIMQVNQGIEQMSQVVQTNSATAQEGAAASEELNGQAELLKEKLQQFKLKTGGRENILPAGPKVMNVAAPGNYADSKY